MQLPSPNQHTNREATHLVEYDPQWPAAFEAEKQRLQSLLPPSLATRIEHFGSTAIPGISAKPIIDMLVEVVSHEHAKSRVPAILEPLGYEFYWRAQSDDENTYYCWFIKRNAEGERTHHLHFIEGSSTMWRRIKFRDYLREFPDVAKSYEALKRELSKRYPHDRSAYTHGKSKFVAATTNQAIDYYR